MMHAGFGSGGFGHYLQNGAGVAAAVTAAAAAAAAARVPASYYHPIIYWPYPSPPVSPTTYYTP